MTGQIARRWSVSLSSRVKASGVDASLFCADTMLQGARMKIRHARSITLAAASIALTIAMVTSIAGCGGSSAAADSASSSLLPRNFVVLVNLVTQYFDAITQQESTGEDSTAQGNPVATRAVFFVNDTGTLLVTITADRYRNTSDAGSAYQTALRKSEAVPGFTPISIPPVGQQSFAGSVTQGAETHVGPSSRLGEIEYAISFEHARRLWWHMRYRLLARGNFSRHSIQNASVLTLILRRWRCG
jgi:hypothetical protein